MKTRKVELPFTQGADTIICPYCEAEYVIYRIWRKDTGIEAWPQVGGYCYMCGKNVKEKL